MLSWEEIYLKLCSHHALSYIDIVENISGSSELFSISSDLKKNKLYAMQFVKENFYNCFNESMKSWYAEI